MAIYKKTLEEASQKIVEKWADSSSKPNIFALVQVSYGERYMIDYTETNIQPSIKVIQDLRDTIDDICGESAAKQENPSVVELEEGITLHDAIIRRDPEKVRALINRGDDIQAIDNDGATPLHYATYISSSEIAETLLHKGALVDARNAKGETPLHEAAGHSHREEDEATLEALLEGGASLNAQDNDGATPLHAAAIAGHYEAARLLLDHGAEIQAVAQQLTPLHFSAYAGKPEVTQLLIERGADVFAEKDGMTPLHMAQQPSDANEADKLAVAQMLEQAMACGNNAQASKSSSQAGSDLAEFVYSMAEENENITVTTLYPNASCDEDVLITAAGQGDVNSVRKLLQKELSANTTIQGGITALMAVSTTPHVKVAELLLESGAEINSKDDRGVTALMAASFSNQREMVSLLISHGADIKLQSNEGLTAIELAKDAGHSQIVTLLQQSMGSDNDSKPWWQFW